MKDQKEIIKGKSEKEIKLDQSNSNDGIKKDSKKKDSDLYISNPSKYQRGRLRSKRDSFIRKIFKFNEEKDIENRNKMIEEFKNFYKKEYIKNDYSHDSLSRSNHPSTRENIEEFLSHLKRWKIEL